MVYLTVHPPATPQFRTTRRPKFATPVTGAIVVHTAESRPDLTLPDDGAEGVARFISTRKDPGSYHSVVDSDSIVRVGEYEWEMFHEGTGGNRWSLGLSFACHAAQWSTLPADWVTGALELGAMEADNMADWASFQYGIEIPAVHITAAEYRAGEPGFIGHGELDPGRRSDPGAQFPWARFLAKYQALRAGEPPMPEPGHTYNLMDLSDTMKQVHELYWTHRGWDAHHPEEIAEWGRDIAVKLGNHEDPVPTLEYIRWALAKEREASAVAGG